MTQALDPSQFDTSVRIADDLYRHVNGRWLESEQIPDDKPMTGAFVRLRDDSEAEVHAILDELAGADESTLTEEQAKIAALYGDFMDAERVEELDAAPLSPLLERIDGIDSVAALQSYLGWAVRYGLTSLWGCDVEADPGDPQQYVFFVAQDGLGLPDESYYREEQHVEILAEYGRHVARTLALAGVEDAERQAEEVVALEKAIAACHWDRVRTRDLRQMYNPRTVAELAEEAPGFGWDFVLDGGSIRGLGLVVDCQPSFFVDVAPLLSDERLGQWRSWARFHAISGTSPYLSSRFVDERFGFYERTLQGTPQLRERWKRGVALAERALGEAIGKIYVERRFSPTAKERMDELVANLIEAYRTSISDLEWMTPETKAEALVKLAAFRPKIGYPATWRDYSALSIVPGDLVGNVERVSAFELDYALSKLGGPMNPDEWQMYPQTVNAYYHPLRNEIVFPAAILQPPFFAPLADDAVNYGGIGAVIGHEIGHGFDDQGSTCDGEGRLRNWWTDADRAAFEERTGALIGQYNALSPAQAPGHFVNGALTIGENIGDLGGLGIAIKAWRLAGGEDDPPIDGLTGLQRLFLSWATVWQTKSRDALVLQRLATDPHSPPEFRCNQIVRNIDDFYAAFGVVESDALWLPEQERVTIW
ncbi:MAG TPA: M13-type metalloendopeptidase [Propionibacteriaceae bacterium]|nr:M13-type metalloendopeptidase [Propionibacteriaceae bacterium]